MQFSSINVDVIFKDCGQGIAKLYNTAFWWSIDNVKVDVSALDCYIDIHQFQELSHVW